MDLELYLVRHGESVGNVTPGEDMPDCPLTTRGEKQANLVAQRLMDIGITHIISSPLIRTLQTAQPLARAMKMPIFVMGNAYEVRDLESCKGAKLSDLMDQFPEAKFDDDFEPNGWHYEGHETPDMARERASNIVKQIKEYPEDAKIAMFTHALLNQYIIKEIIGLDNSSETHFHQENTCINKFIFRKTRSVVRKLGDINHLQALSHPAKN